MSISIGTVTIGSIEDRRLVLVNAQAARVIDIGTNWSRIRIGLRLNFDDTGGNLTGTPRLYIGMLSSPSAGLANGPLGNSTSHFVGAISNTATLPRAAGPPVSYSSFWSNGTSYAKKIGSTITTAAGTATNGYISASPSTVRQASMIEITKGSPNFTISILAAIATGGTDISSVANFQIAMSINLLTGVATYFNALYGNVYTGNSTANLPVSEATDGFLNGVCVAWDKTNAVNISDLMWAKMA